MTPKVRLRVMTRRDIPGAMRLVREQGWNQRPADWEVFLRADPGRCFVAVVGPKIVGSVGTISYERKVFWISMLLVDQRYRSLGIGRRLLETAIRSLRGRGAIRLDATPEGRKIYRRYGFKDEFKLLRMTIRKFPRLGPVKALISTERDLPALVRSDGDVFGVERPRLLRSLFLRRPHSTWHLQGKRGVTAICFSRPRALFHQLGPLEADSLQSAKVLVRGASERVAGQPVAMDVPVSQVHFRRWLLRLGFRAQRPLYRMVLGRSGKGSKLSKLFAVAGPEFG